MNTPNEVLTSLRQRRIELADRLSRINADRTRTQGPVSQDFADQAQERENDEVLDQLEPLARDELLQLDHAIQRAEEGGYGICEVCGEDIGRRRLALLPQATTCTSCADQQRRVAS